MSVTHEKLFNQVYLDFTGQLGWDKNRGITKAENLQHSSDNDTLVVKSRVKDLRVLVVAEETFDGGIKLLRLSDTQFSIAALAWDHTDGVVSGEPLLSRVIELHDFDVSARHTPLETTTEKGKTEQEQLQFSLVIHRLQVLQEWPILPARSGVEIRWKANVKQFLAEFEALRASPGVTNGAVGSMDVEIATQVPANATATETQETGQTLSASQRSHGSLRDTSVDIRIQPQNSRLPQAAAAREAKTAKWRQPVPYDVDEDWAETVNGDPSTRNFRIPRAQLKTMKWAPAPGTRNVPPNLPKKDLELMEYYADHEDDYIDLVQDDHDKQEAHDDASDEDDEDDADIIAAAEKLRRRQDSPDDEELGQSQWPASDPPEPPVELGTGLNTRPLSQMNTPDELSDDEAERLHQSLPPDSDDQAHGDDGQGSQRSIEVTTEQDHENDSDHSLIDRDSRRKTTIQGVPAFEMESDEDDNGIAGSSSEELTEDEYKLAGLYKAARDQSPRKAKLYRALQATKQRSKNLADHQNKSGTTMERWEKYSNEQASAGTQLHSSPSSQLHHVHAAEEEGQSSATGVQVGRTPYPLDKRALSVPKSGDSVIKNTAIPPKQTSPSPISRTMPPPSSSLRLPSSSRQTASSSAPQPVNYNHSSQVSENRQNQSSSSRDFSSSVEGKREPFAVNGVNAQNPSRTQSTPRRVSSRPPSSPHDSAKRKLEEPSARDLNIKKAKLYALRDEPFELSQDLLEHAGSDYAVDDLRAEHFGWRGRAASTGAGIDAAMREDREEEDMILEEPVENTHGNVPVIGPTTGQDGGAATTEATLYDGQAQPDEMQVDHDHASLETERGQQQGQPDSRAQSPVQHHSVRSNSNRHHAPQVQAQSGTATILDRNRHATPQVQVRSHSQVESPVLSAQGNAGEQVFVKFKQAYPLWDGKLKDFLDMCHKLSTAKVMKVFYDDFMIRYREEYRHYVLECFEDIQNPMPYEEWFDENIETRKFTSGILNRDTLAQVLNGDEDPSSTASFRVPSAPGSARSFQAPSNRDSFSRANAEDSRPAVTAQRAGSHTTPVPNSRPSAPAATPDVPRSSGSRRSLPWQTDRKTSNRADIPPSTSFRRSLPNQTNGSTSKTAIELDLESYDDDDEVAITGHISRSPRQPSKKPAPSRSASTTVTPAARAKARAQSISASPADTASTTSKPRKKRQVIIPPDEQARRKLKAQPMTEALMNYQSQQQQQPVTKPVNIFKNFK